MGSAAAKPARALRSAALRGGSARLYCARYFPKLFSSSTSSTLTAPLSLVGLPQIHVRSFHHGLETVLPSLISTTSPGFLEKAEAMDKLVADLEAHLLTARLGGGTAALEKMRSSGKKTPRERLSLLLDKETPFLELSSLAAHDVYPGQYTPGASLITGIGRIAGRECMIIVNDASVKGGSYLPLTVSHLTQVISSCRIVKTKRIG